MQFSFEIGEQLKCDGGLGYISLGWLYIGMTYTYQNLNKKIKKYYVPKRMKCKIDRICLCESNTHGLAQKNEKK